MGNSFNFEFVEECSSNAVVIPTQSQYYIPPKVEVTERFSDPLPASTLFLAATFIMFAMGAFIRISTKRGRYSLIPDEAASNVEHDDVDKDNGEILFVETRLPVVDNSTITSSSDYQHRIADAGARYLCKTDGGGQQKLPQHIRKRNVRRKDKQFLRRQNHHRFDRVDHLYLSLLSVHSIQILLNNMEQQETQRSARETKSNHNLENEHVGVLQTYVNSFNYENTTIRIQTSTCILYCLRWKTYTR